MKKVFVIGIGTGDPEHLTMQGVNALNQVDVFFLMEKGPQKQKLIDVRKEICRKYIKDRNFRFVESASPEWDRDSKDYFATVAELNQEKQDIFKRFVIEGMAEGESGAFLVWGDPALYDSTIRNLQRLMQSGSIEFEYEIIPGLSSIQILAAKHRTTLNRLGECVEITTGRKLRERSSPPVDTTVVMLDGQNSFKTFSDQTAYIYWGAYLGTPDEILISGELSAVSEEIERVREQARRENGWIMDCYLLRSRDDNQN